MQYNIVSVIIDHILLINGIISYCLPMDITHNCLLGNYMQNMILNIIIYGIFAGEFMTQLIKHNRSILYGVMGYPLIICKIYQNAQ